MDPNSYCAIFLRKLLKDMMTQTGYKLIQRKTGILGSRRFMQERGEGNSLNDGKGKSLNHSCAPAQRGAREKKMLGGMPPERCDNLGI